MAERFIEDICRTVAFIGFHEALNISQRVGPALTIGASVGTRLARVLADSSKGQELRATAKA